MLVIKLFFEVNYTIIRLERPLFIFPLVVVVAEVLSNISAIIPIRKRKGIIAKHKTIKNTLNNAAPIPIPTCSSPPSAAFFKFAFEITDVITVVIIIIRLVTRQNFHIKFGAPILIA